MNIQLYTNHTLGVDLYINKATGEVFTTIRGAAVICQVSHQAVSKFIDKLNAQKPGNLVSLKTVEVPTKGGLQGGNQIDEPLLLKLIGHYRPELLMKCAEAGLRVFLHGLVGIEYTGQSVQPTPPPALPPADVRIANLYTALKGFGIDATNPRISQHLQDLVQDKILGAGPALPAGPEWLGVAEKAERMGYPVGLVTKHRSQLGKWVKARISQPPKQEKRLCNGTMRDIYLYPDNKELSDLIEAFMANLA
jgi:hypothetical protein